jgi:hypothetical protein
MGKRARTVAILLSTLLLAGCGSQVFDHPLADAKTSVADPHLIGTWELAGTEKADGTRESDEGPQPRIHIGRAEEHANVLEGAWIELKKEHLAVRRLKLYASRVGTQRWLSISLHDLGPKGAGFDVEGDAGYVLLSYAITKDGLLRLHGLDQDTLVKAVRAGELAGTATTHAAVTFPGPKKGSSLPVTDVRVTANAAQVAAWILAHPHATSPNALVLRRIRFAKDEQEGEDAKPPPPAPPDKAREDYEKARVPPPVPFAGSELRAGARSRGLFRDLPAADATQLAELARAYRAARTAAATHRGARTGGAAGESYRPSDEELKLAEAGLRLQQALDRAGPAAARAALEKAGLGPDERPYVTFEIVTVKVFGTGFVRTVARRDVHLHLPGP